MRFWTWLRERIGAEQAARRGRHKLRKLPSRPPPRFRPRLEALEDRCLPSTLTVTSPVDDVNMPGTLRYDVAHAQSGDTIRITPALHGAPIVLTQGELVLDKSLTIKAQKNHPATISGNNNSRVFEVASGAHVSLINLAITDGNGVADNPAGTSQDDGEGGGILNFGTLTVIASNVSGNSALDGGGISNVFGTLTVNASTLSGNSATIDGVGVSGEGGGIYNFFGALTVNDSTLSGNSARGGGGILSFGTVTVSDSTLSGNSATFEGGGIFSGGTVTVSDSTLSGNSAAFFGGGIFNDGTATVSGSTLSGNSAAQGGGIFNRFGTLTANDSTVSGNDAPLGADLYLAGGVLINNNSTIGDIFP